MKYLLLYSSLVLFGTSSFAQNSSELVQWQKEHPNQMIMRAEVYNQLDSIQQLQLQDKVLLVEDIDFSDTSFELQTVNVDVTDQFESENFVKIWLAQNNSVKIVRRSEYDAASPELRAIYDEPSTLVLAGEEITRRDIENY